MSFINNNNLFLLEEIVKKNFSSKYKDSFLGIFWTILYPLMMMALFTIVFSTLFKRNIENFQVYFLSGWCLYTFFSSTISAAMNSLRGNKNILKRTPAPKHIFVLGSIISEFLNFIITFVLLIVIMIVTKAPFHATMIFSIIPVIALLIMVIGLGLIVAVLSVYYSDVQHLWRVLSLMFMYASALFYPMSIIPEPYHKYMILNPIFWAIDQFRCFVYHGIFPQSIYVLNLILLSLIILVLGLIIFEKYDDKLTRNF